MKIRLMSLILLMVLILNGCGGGEDKDSTDSITFISESEIHFKESERETFKFQLKAESTLSSKLKFQLKGEKDGKFFTLNGSILSFDNYYSNRGEKKSIYEIDVVASVDEVNIVNNNNTTNIHKTSSRVSKKQSITIIFGEKPTTTPIPTVTARPTPTPPFSPIASNEDIVNSTNLILSKTNRGSTLVYPTTYAMNGWKTTIIIKNIKPYATIVRAGFFIRGFSGGYGEDMADILIYLTAFETVVFTIRDGRFYTSSASIPTLVRNPKYGVDKDDAVFLDIGGNAELEILSLPVYNITASKGYILVQGMTQYNVKNKYSDIFDLWKDYRKLLDSCRPGWRDAYEEGGMVGGEMQISVNSQKVDAGCADDINLKNFVGLMSDTLEGSIEIITAESEHLVFPATAFRSSEQNSMFLTAPGELFKYE